MGPWSASSLRRRSAAGSCTSPTGASRGWPFPCLPRGAIEAGAVDLSHLAIDAPFLPWSLGIQPQLARLRLLSPSVGGAFPAPSVTIEQAVSGYVARMKQLGVSPWSGPVRHRAWIGEQVSLLYYPLARRNGHLVDALQDRPLAPVDRRGTAGA
ncbi:MAG: hypothetical protein IPI61_14955 [Syntrophaceae bacterium]|nr:hypothetical protein [Syntrophaceae bacterium]